MRNRPLVLLAACYGAGAAVGYGAQVPLWIWGCALTALAIGFALCRRSVFLYAAAVFAGALITAACAVAPVGLPEGEAMLQGRVARPASVGETRTTLTLTDVRIDGESVGYDVRAYVYQKIEVAVDDSVSMRANLWLPQGQRNPGGFDFARWLWNRGVALCATAQTDGVQVARESNFTPGSLLERCREAIGMRIDALFGEHAALVRALILGDRDRLPAQIESDYRRAGVVHLLAISGLHVSCLAMAVDMLLRRLCVSRQGAYCIVLPLLAIYAAMVGFTPSVTRAAVMYAMLRGAPLLGRPYDGLSALAAAFMGILLARPLAIADAGFILSFSAVAGIQGFARPLSQQLRLPDGRLRRVADMLSVSLAALIGSAPATLAMYGSVSPYALLTNLACVPLATVALPCVLAALGCSVLWTPLGLLTARIAGALLSMLNALAAFVAELPGAVLLLGAWPVWLYPAYALCAIGASRYSVLKPKMRAFCACALALAFVLGAAANRRSVPEGLQVDFLDVGQADAAVVWAQGEAYLMDTGEAGGALYNYLAHRGCVPAAVFLSHPHDDHCGGLGDLAESAHVERVYLPECWNRMQPTEAVIQTLQMLQAHGTRVEYLAAGDVVRLSEEVCAEVIHPPAGYQPGGANDGSLVLRVCYGDGSALFTGDMESTLEWQTVPDCDVLKAAHHGEDAANNELLMRLSSPSALVVSVGRNGYGHPSWTLLERAARLGARVYRTDRQGMVSARIEADGRVEMRTFLTDDGELQ